MTIFGNPLADLPGNPPRTPFGLRTPVWKPLDYSINSTVRRDVITTNLDSRCPCRSRWCYPDTRRSSLFHRRRVWSRYDTQRRPTCRIPSHQYSTHRSTVLATWHNISLKTRRQISAESSKYRLVVVVEREVPAYNFEKKIIVDLQDPGPDHLQMFHVLIIYAF